MAAQGERGLRGRRAFPTAVRAQVVRVLCSDESLRCPRLILFVVS